MQYLLPKGFVVRAMFFRLELLLIKNTYMFEIMRVISTCFNAVFQDGFKKTVQVPNTADYAVLDLKMIQLFGYKR